jgi:2-dehydro-3-deoxyphosphooctonate aldolase (KDO 8-P synthase)
MLQRVKEAFELPILTDIHEPHQAAPVGEVCDVLQIPAFLCRQTDLLVAAAHTGKIVNIKKAQFLSAADMRHAVAKVEESGNTQLLLTERGSMFGFNSLVVDYTGVVDMMRYGYPVVMDATHSVQKPGGLGGKSGGNREFVPYLAQAAAAVGVRGFFMETHPAPDEALSDGPNMVPLDRLDAVLARIVRVMQAVE